MKTETKIAKENIEVINRNHGNNKLILKCAGEMHKQTCQRWLSFLKEEMEKWNTMNEISGAYISTGELEEKIQDLKQAIKVYEDVGV